MATSILTTPKMALVISLELTTRYRLPFIANFATLRRFRDLRGGGVTVRSWCSAQTPAVRGLTCRGVWLRFGRCGSRGRPGASEGSRVEPCREAASGCHRSGRREALHEEPGGQSGAASPPRSRRRFCHHPAVIARPPAALPSLCDRRQWPTGLQAAFAVIAEAHSTARYTQLWSADRERADSRGDPL